MPKATLTTKLVKTLPPGLYWDEHPDAPSGFGLRVTEKGARSYVLNYRNRDGVERRLTLGDVTVRTPQEARKQAAAIRRGVEDGGDPLEERRQQRDAPTVAQLWGDFEKESLPSRAARTQAGYKAMMRDHILPALGRLKVAAVTRADIEKLHRRITDAGTSRRANQVKSLCSVLFGHAIALELRSDNPARGIKNNKEHARRRYLDDEKHELERLNAALKEWRPRCLDAVDVTEIATLTGARRGEILGMRWSQIDLARALWHQSPSDTKQRDWHSPALPPRAVEILKRRRAEYEQRAGGKIVALGGDDFVFAGGNSKTACDRFESRWKLIRATAGLNDLRFHDLRHSVASWLITAGFTLDAIGQVLGHKRVQTTRRYAHLMVETRRAAAAVIGDKVAGGVNDSQ